MAVGIVFIVIGGLGLLVFLGVMIGLTIWQVRLSKMERAWPGLIIPIVQAGFAAFMVLGLQAVTRVIGLVPGKAMPVIALVAAIPAIVSIAIYIPCRVKRGSDKR